MNKRVAVIGAGPSGLAQLRAFQSAAAKGAEIPEIVCFEKQADWGGLWNYTWRTGLDEHGDPVHGSMYRYLWSNGPKECLEFADYTFEEHFGRPIGSYPPRAVLWDYIKGRVEKSGVRKWVRFNTPVRMVTWSDETKKFTVTAHDRTNDHTYSEEFDHVVVASGHFSMPNVPYFEGFETFHGRILHSHDFRDAHGVQGQGRARSSAAPIRPRTSARNATNTAPSRSPSATAPRRWASTGPRDWEQKPLLQKVVGKTAHFKDGTTKEVDAIILCTGYLHSLPVPHRRPEAQDQQPHVAARPLQGRGVGEEPEAVLHRHAGPVLHLQHVRRAGLVRARRHARPHQAAVGGRRWRRDSAEWRAREETLADAEQMIWFQGDYTKELIEATDYPSFDIEETNKTFMEWEHHKMENIMGFRDNAYRSLMTGTMAPKHHTPWMEAMDDSLESYLQTK